MCCAVFLALGSSTSASPVLVTSRPSRDPRLSTELTRDRAVSSDEHELATDTRGQPVHALRIQQIHRGIGEGSVTRQRWDRSSQSRHVITRRPQAAALRTYPLTPSSTPDQDLFRRQIESFWYHSLTTMSSQSLWSKSSKDVSGMC